MGTAIGGLTVGAAVGSLMSRNTICFNAGLRRAVFERRGSILRIFAVAVALQLLLLPLLILFNADLFSTVATLPAIGLFPLAQVLGGLLFGAGMALAGGCITGVLWKSGAGSAATAIAIAGFAVGELLVRRGPFDSVPSDLDAAIDPPAEQTLYGVAGLDYAPLALAAGAVGLFLLWRRSRSLPAAGLILGALGAITWVVAGWVDYGYGLGFVGAAESVRSAAETGDAGALDFQVFLAVGVVAGAAVAVRGPLRLPDLARGLRAGGGGIAMGIGATLAHGCNIGNGLTGIPLLSLGSILATSAMAVGAILTWRLVLAPSPRLRGSERPEADW